MQAGSLPGGGGSAGAELSLLGNVRGGAACSQPPRGRMPAEPWPQPLSWFWCRHSHVIYSRMLQRTSLQNEGLSPLSREPPSHQLET